VLACCVASNVEQSSSAMEVEPFLQAVLRDSWQAFKRDPVLFIGASWLAALLTVVSLGLLLGPLTVGFIQLVHRRLHGQSARIGDLFEGMSAFVSSVLASVVIGLGIALGLCLAVIPGLFVGVATCFAFHELSYRKSTAIDAIKGSFVIFKTHLLHVLLLLVAIATLNALGHLTVLGVLVTVPFSLVLTTVAYEKLTGQTTGSQIVAMPE
jgi:uncharacterized membrane protein